MKFSHKRPSSMYAENFLSSVSKPLDETQSRCKSALFFPLYGGNSDSNSYRTVFVF